MDNLLSSNPPQRPNNPLYTSLIMQWELGDLVHSLTLAKWNEETNYSKRAFTVEAKLALSDLYTQCRVMAEQLGVDPEELRKIGEERYLDRCKEIKGKYGEG